MSSTERLQRYLSDARDGCGDEAVAQRLAELEALDADAGGPALDEDVTVMSALANETRYTLVRVLVAADGELCVCELDALVDVSESGLSHALSALVDAGLVDSRKDGRWKKYRATNRAIALLTVLEGAVDE